jgi:tRNA 2-thiouridine synthesizing protein A|tara:strand:+ start:25 stop:312 length:288 start_codon:yes stop_codon:yes gene_type:complete
MWQRNISALSEKANYQMDDEITLVDASGLKCPLPVLKARKALQSLTDGDKLRVISTDPASPLDFKHFCNSKGHSLISVEEKEESFEFVIVKSCSQ